MFGLEIFVRVQTFRQVPPVLPCNFCHPDMDQPAVQYIRGFIKTFTFSGKKTCEKHEKCFFYFFYTAPTKNR